MFQLSLRDNPLVVRFVSEMSYQPASLLELSARAVKLFGIPYYPGDIPATLFDYINSAHHCVNPECKGETNNFVERVLVLVFHIYSL